MRKAVAIYLSFCLWMFLAAGLVSLVDDYFGLATGSSRLIAFSATVTVLSLLLTLLAYLLMGLSPIVPKRLVLPLAFFSGIALFLTFPQLIYLPNRIRETDCLLSALQLILGLGLAARMGGFKPRWCLVDEKQLGERWFSFVNTLTFLAANVLIVVPAALIYSSVCLALAISHYSDGFLTLHPSGLCVQARKYVRPDGKSVELIPMIHIGDAGFYSTVSRSFPTNSLILMEGVTDRRSLLTNEISYKRVAKSLGLSEQEDNFAPANGDMVFADVDVAQFNTNTIGFLNLVMLVHSQGLNPRTVKALFDYTPPPHVEDLLIEDLLHKRNQHILDEVHARLAKSDYVVLPWGAAHMPGLARQIQNDGFRLDGAHDYVVIHFFAKKAS